MIVVREETCREIIGRPEAFKAVEDVFAAMARGDAYNFPVIREAIGHADAERRFWSHHGQVDAVAGNELNHGIGVQDVDRFGRSRGGDAGVARSAE